MGVVADSIRRSRTCRSYHVKPRFIHGFGCDLCDRIRHDPVFVHKMNEPYVNHALMERVMQIKSRSENSRLVLEVVGITDLWNKAIHMTEEELIVCTLAALQICPDMVYQALASDRAELVRKGKNNDGRIEDDT